MTARSGQWEKRSAERPPLRPQRPGEDAGVGPRAGDRMIDRRLLQPEAREAGRAGFPGGGKGRGKRKGRGGMAGGARPGQSRRGEGSGAAGTAGPALGAHPRCCSREHRRRAVGPGVAAALPSASSFHFPSAPDFLLFCFFFLPTLSALCLPSVSAWARLFEERRFPVRVFPLLAAGVAGTCGDADPGRVPSLGLQPGPGKAEPRQPPQPKPRLCALQPSPGQSSVQ